jgi:secreted protein with Ig-like and vWFA domain
MWLYRCLSDGLVSERKLLSTGVDSAYADRHIVSMTKTQQLTAAEKNTARAIRATMDEAGRLKDADTFRALCRASRERHGEDRHEVVKWHALHMRAA